jgi:Tol biopolymer transport system component
MPTPFPFKHARRALGLAGFAALLSLAACGGGGGGADTPAPVTHTVSVRVDSPLATGDAFSFGLGAQTLSVTASGTAVAFAQAVAEGSSYSVSQTAGPRTCTLSSNRSGTLGAANVLVTANCGVLAGSSRLTGTLRAAVGTQVTLQFNGGADLPAAVTRTTGNTDVYDETAFSFAALLADGAAYQVSIAAKPANQTCSVYKGASGTLPVSATALRVGCDFTYDHVSRNTAGTVLATRTESFVPSIGGAAGPLGSTTQGYGEGRFVAFVSSAAGLSPNGQRQVFWRDRLTGETKLVSATSAGVAGNGASDRPVISADGLVVVFESDASNLVAGDTNGATDIFGWSAVDSTQTVERLSVGPAGLQANAASHGATVSADGRVVAFATNASNLTAGVVGTSTTNVVRRDVLAATNTLVSANGAGTGVGGDAPMLSEDGNRLVFWSFAADLVTGDTNGLWDIFVYQHSTGSQRRVSLRADGGERNQGSESASRLVWPAISGNGRFVAYATTATNVVTGDTNAAQDVFVVDLEGSLGVRRASLGTASAQGNGDSPAGQGERVALSFDGTWMAFTSTATNFGSTVGSISNVYLRNLTSGELRVVTDASFGADVPTLSRNAAFVAFGAGAPLDSRYASSGVFVHFTGVTRSWWWVD